MSESWAGRLQCTHSKLGDEDTGPWRQEARGPPDVKKWRSTGKWHQLTLWETGCDNVERLKTKAERRELSVFIWHCRQMTDIMRTIIISRSGKGGGGSFFSIWWKHETDYPILVKDPQKLQQVRNNLCYDIWNSSLLGYDVVATGKPIFF
jgi:hypothetical protein